MSIQTIIVIIGICVLEQIHRKKYIYIDHILKSKYCPFIFLNCKSYMLLIT